MLIQGKKTVLRRAEPSDLLMLLEWDNDPELQRLGYAKSSFPTSLRDIEERFLHHKSDDEGTTERLVVTTRDSGLLIGISMVFDIDWHNRNCRTGILIGPKEFRGQGYGSDARAALLDFVFQHLNMHRVYGGYLAENEASRRLSTSQGSQVIGRLIQEAYVNGRYCDIIQNSVSRERFYAAMRGSLGGTSELRGAAQ